MTTRKKKILPKKVASSKAKQTKTAAEILLQVKLIDLPNEILLNVFKYVSLNIKIRKKVISREYIVLTNHPMFRFRMTPCLPWLSPAEYYHPWPPTCYITSSLLGLATRPLACTVLHQQRYWRKSLECQVCTQWWHESSSSCHTTRSKVDPWSSFETAGVGRISMTSVFPWGIGTRGRRLR